MVDGLTLFVELLVGSLLCRDDKIEEVDCVGAPSILKFGTKWHYVFLELVMVSIQKWFMII
jgi:hypothetical protein